MQVGTSLTSSAVSAGSSTAASTPASIGYDAFLQLLIAQLKNQDPTKPMDSGQYVSQLASLSNLEQTVKQNATLENILAASAFSQANLAIGNRVTSADGTVSGIVVSTRIYADGVVAELDSGAMLLLQPGVVIEKP